MSKWNSVVWGGGAMLVLAGAALWMQGARGTSGAGTAAIGISPPSQNAPVSGDPIRVDVRVENVADLGSYEFTLKFDTAMLSFLGVSDRGFLTGTGRVQQCTGAAGNANIIGAVKYGCNTLGLVENAKGKPGPDGSGVLATLQFVPVAPGTSPLTFIDETWYQQDRLISNEISHTALGGVETCVYVDDQHPSVCTDNPISADLGTGAVGMYAPDQPTPTALPATPTAVPAQPTPSDSQATVIAAVGHDRTLSTPSAGRLENDNGGDAAAHSITGNSSATGVLSADNGGTAAGTGDGSVAGTAAGPQGALSGSASSAGSSSSRAGGSASRAPVAGYGPEPHPHPWPGRAGAALMALGCVALASGFAIRRRTA